MLKLVKKTPFPPQQLAIDHLTEVLRSKPGALNGSDTGTGKCWAPGTQFMLYDGTSKAVENIAIGDRLMGPDGSPRLVKDVGSGVDEMFEISLPDGTKHVCNSEHILCLRVTGSGSRRLTTGPDGTKYESGDELTISVRDYLRSSASFRHLTKWYRAGVDFPATSSKPAMPVPPYLLGVWLGDGTVHGSQLCKPQIGDMIAEDCAAVGWDVSVRHPVDRCTYANVSGGMRVALRELGVLNNKHIPHHYLTGSREVRKKVLAGLLDTDGSVCGNSGWEFSSKDLVLAEGVQFLARSLGARATLKPRTTSCNGKQFDSYRVHIFGGPDLPTKLKFPSKRRMNKDPLVTGFKIRSVGTGPYYGVVIDGDRRHLLSDFSVVHNTLMSVEVCKNLGLSVLVVCPKAVIPAWRHSFAEQEAPRGLLLGVTNYDAVRLGNTKFGKWEKNEKVVVRKGRKATKTKPERKTTYRIERGEFQWNPAIGLIIFDEVHVAKTRGSLNSKLVYHAHDGQRRIMALSATVAENPSEFKSLGYVLGLHNYTNFLPWAKARGCYTDNWRKLAFTTSMKKARPILEQLASEIYPENGYRVSRADMGDYFTRTSITTEPLDFGSNAEMAKLYAEVETEMLAVEDAEEMDVKEGPAKPLVEALRARQKVELLKIPLTLDMINEATEKGFHVAVFMNFNATIVALNEKLGGTCPIVWGTDPRDGSSQTGAERETAIRRFQSNEAPVILLNIAAGGVAIDLHDTVGDSPRLALISPNWNAKMVHQVLGRVDRAGAQSDTLQRVLIAADTIEEDISEALDRKLNHLTLLNQMPTTHDLTPPAREKKPDAPAPEPAAETKPDTATQPAHAAYGPSFMRYAEVCPSAKARPDDPNEPPHPVTLAGSRLHDALENDDPSSLIDEEEEHLFHITREMAQHFEEVHGVGEAPQFNELRVTIDLGEHDTFGTVDRVRVVDDVAVVQDYKFGYTPIEDVSINAQGWLYSLGVFQRFPEVNVIYFYFLIPRQDEVSMGVFVRDRDVELPEGVVWENPADGEIEVTATADDIKLRFNLVLERVRLLRGKEFNPQPHNCEFCGDKVGCGALAEKALVIARNYNPDGLELPETLDPQHMNTPEQIGRARMLVIPLEGWIKAVKAQANVIAFEEGFEIPGFKRIWKKTRRTVTDINAAYNLAHEDFGLTHHDFMDCVGSVKITELENKVAEHAPHGKKSLAKEQFSLGLEEADALTGGDEEVGTLRIDRKQNK